MLSDVNIHKINQKIEKELGKLGTFMNDDEKSLEMIKSLTAALHAQPEHDEIVSELATAIVEKAAATSQPSNSTETLIKALFNR